MRIKNATGRDLHIGGSVKLMPGQVFALAQDALHLTKRPLFKSYLSDGSIVFEDARPKEAVKKPEKKKD